MKNRIIKVFSIIALILLMSGCVKYNVNMKITEDKKMEMELIIAASKSLQNENNNDGSVEMTDDTESIEKLKKEGWKVTDYEDDEYIGSKLSKTFNNIDDVSASSETEYDLNSLLEEGKDSKYIFYKKTEGGKSRYVAKFKANTDTNSTNQEGDENLEGMTAEEKEEYQKQMEKMSQQMLKTMDLKITVEAPNVISNNATEVDGNKLTWDLTKLKSGENIEFEFELKDGNSSFIIPDGSSFPIIPVAIGGGAVLLVVIIVIALSKKKGNKGETPKTVAPVSTASAPDMTNNVNAAPTQEMNSPMNAAPNPEMMTNTPAAPSIEPTQPAVEPQMPAPTVTTPAMPEPTVPTSETPTTPVTTPINPENNG